MILQLKKIFSPHFYLLLIVAWLFTLSFVLSESSSTSKVERKIKNSIEQELQKKEKEAFQFISDSSKLNKILSAKINNEFNIELSNSSVHYFIYKTNQSGIPQLLFWNKNKVLPNNEDLAKQDDSYFVKTSAGSFEFIKKTLFSKNDIIIIAAFLPIKWEYFIENKYLQSAFDGLKHVDKNIQIISVNDSGLNVINSSGKPFCKLGFPKNKQNIKEASFPLLLKIIGVFILCLYIQKVAINISKYKNFKIALLFLVGVMVICRTLSYFYNFPFSFRGYELFDPSIYASNTLHPSLGDLLINSLLICWVMFFILKYSAQVYYTQKILGKYKKAVGSLLVIFGSIIFFIILETIKSLIKDSKISFDVTNFFRLNINSVIGLLLMCLLLIIFFEIVSYLIQLAKNSFKLSVSYLIVVSISSSVLTVFLFDDFTFGNEYFYYLGWILSFNILIFYSKKITSFVFFKGHIILWLLVLTISLTIFIQALNSTVEIEQRKQIAEKLSLQTDPSGENLLSIAITNFNSDFFVKNINRLQLEYSNKFIKDSLLNENFSGYLNKYDSKMYTFNSLGKPLYNDDSLSLSSILNIIANKSRETSFAGLYYYENTFDKYSYIFENAIINKDSLLGYYFVIAKPKLYKSEALYPELFKQSKDLTADLNIDYSYAVYKNNLLIHKVNDYPFSSILSIQYNDEFKIKKQHDYSELWYNAGNQKVIIVAKKNQGFISYLTLLAYLVCTLMLMLALFKFFQNFAYKGLFKLKSIFNLNIRNQIQLTITLVSIFAFIIIGIVTISFFINRFNESNEDRLIRAIQVVGKEIENKVNTSLAFDDVLTVNELVIFGDLEKKIIEVSEVHNVDVSLFDLQGSLKVSTQPYIYNKKILSAKMDPIAYHELAKKKNIQFIQEEHIGKFAFLSIYISISNTQGKTFAYLNIPYLNSQTELNQEISNFLVAIINLNALVFLLAGFIAFWLTNRITSSFSFIANKMTELNLGEKNEEIIWDKDDELGLLFKEYNKMVKKLEISAETLAKKEREGAWREMARQVAHEIKNPLTPMKLSIQYLQKAVDEDAPNVKELSKNVAETFIEQIDQLSKIAADFSQFANIGMGNAEVLDITDVLHSVVNLYQTNKRVSVHWNKEKGNYLVKADKIQMNRLFTNLIQNAIQSVEIDKDVILKIHQIMKDEFIIIGIEDNGLGINEELYPKIFLPNFTTKSSGTGLGLAICKGIVEKANGEIWFETNENKGTIFYVKLKQVKN